MIINSIQISGGISSINKDSISNTEIQGSLIDTLKAENVAIIGVNITRSLEAAVTASVQALAKNPINIDRTIGYTLCGTLFRIISINYKINKISKAFLHEINIELEFFYEQLINNPVRITPTGLYSYITIKELANKATIPYNGTNYKHLIPPNGEDISVANLLETGLQENVEVVRKSGTMLSTYEWGASQKTHVIPFNNILSEIDIVDNTSVYLFSPKILNFDVDKDGTNNPARALGQQLSVNSNNQQKSTFVYGDEEPDKAPVEILYLRNTSLNHDISGETKVRITEEYTGTILTKKTIEKFGFSYLASDIAQSSNGEVKLQSLASSFWGLIESEETIYEYQQGFYTGKLTQGWKLDRLEVEFPVTDKLPKTLDINTSDLVELAKYQFIKVPFQETEKLELETYYDYYTDIDIQGMVLNFQGIGGSLFYTINPYQSLERFIKKRTRNKYGVTFSEYKPDVATPANFDGVYTCRNYTGIEEKEIEHYTILPSINTRTGAAPVLNIVSLTEFEAAPAKVSNVNIVNANVSKEDKYTTYKTICNSQNGIGLYTSFTQSSSEIAFGRPPGASQGQTDTTFEITDADPTGNPYWDSDLNPYWNKQYIIYDENYDYEFKQVTTYGQLTKPSNIPYYSPTIYLSQFPTESIYFNTFTPQEAFAKAKLKIQKESTLNTGSTISCTILFKLAIEEGDNISIPELGVSGIVQEVNHNIYVKGATSSGQVGGKTVPFLTGETLLTIRVPPDLKTNLKLLEIELDQLAKSKVTIPIPTQTGAIVSQIITPSFLRRGTEL